MRTARYIETGGGIYHITAHTIETTADYPLTEVEKERFYRLLKAMSGFTGVHVLNHALMGNHFHLLLEVPARPAHISEEEIVQRLNCLPVRRRSRLRPGEELARRLKRARLSNPSESAIEALLAPVRRRMFDLSRFMQELLSRFTQQYNLRHGRKGTLWDDRFHSTLVEPSPGALFTVSAYIDLNPYRAGLCDDPFNYRFTGLSAARGNCRFARDGFRRLMQLAGPTQYHHANSSFETHELSRYLALVVRYSLLKPGTMPPDWRKAPPSLATYLAQGHFRCRYLARGKILGSILFIEDHLLRWKRIQHLKKPPSPLACPEGGPLYMIHPLRHPL